MGGGNSKGFEEERKIQYDDYSGSSSPEVTEADDSSFCETLSVRGYEIETRASSQNEIHELYEDPLLKSFRLFLQECDNSSKISTTSFEFEIFNSIDLKDFITCFSTLIECYYKDPDNISVYKDVFYQIYRITRNSPGNFAQAFSKIFLTEFCCLSSHYRDWKNIKSFTLLLCELLNIYQADTFLIKKQFDEWIKGIILEAINKDENAIDALRAASNRLSAITSPLKEDFSYLEYLLDIFMLDETKETKLELIEDVYKSHRLASLTSKTESKAYEHETKNSRKCKLFQRFLQSQDEVFSNFDFNMFLDITTNELEFVSQKFIDVAVDDPKRNKFLAFLLFEYQRNLTTIRGFTKKVTQLLEEEINNLDTKETDWLQKMTLFICELYISENKIISPTMMTNWFMIISKIMTKTGDQIVLTEETVQYCRLLYKIDDPTNYESFNRLLMTFSQNEAESQENLESVYQNRKFSPKPSATIIEDFTTFLHLLNIGDDCNLQYGNVFRLNLKKDTKMLIDLVVASPSDPVKLAQFIKTFFDFSFTIGKLIKRIKANIEMRMDLLSVDKQMELKHLGLFIAEMRNLTVIDKVTQTLWLEKVKSLDQDKVSSMYMMVVKRMMNNFQVTDLKLYQNYSELAKQQATQECREILHNVVTTKIDNVTTCLLYSIRTGQKPSRPPNFDSFGLDDFTKTFYLHSISNRFISKKYVNYLKLQRESQLIKSIEDFCEFRVENIELFCSDEVETIGELKFLVTLYKEHLIPESIIAKLLNKFIGEKKLENYQKYLIKTLESQSDRNPNAPNSNEFGYQVRTLIGYAKNSIRQGDVRRASGTNWRDRNNLAQKNVKANRSQLMSTASSTPAKDSPCSSQAGPGNLNSQTTKSFVRPFQAVDQQNHIRQQFSQLSIQDNSADTYLINQIIPAITVNIEALKSYAITLNGYMLERPDLKPTILAKLYALKRILRESHHQLLVELVVDLNRNINVFKTDLYKINDRSLFVLTIVAVARFIESCSFYDMLQNLLDSIKDGNHPALLLLIDIINGSKEILADAGPDRDRFIHSCFVVFEKALTFKIDLVTRNKVLDILNFCMAHKIGALSQMTGNVESNPQTARSKQNIQSRGNSCSNQKVMKPNEKNQHYRRSNSCNQQNRGSNSCNHQNGNPREANQPKRYFNTNRQAGKPNGRNFQARRPHTFNQSRQNPNSNQSNERSSRNNKQNEKYSGNGDQIAKSSEANQQIAKSSEVNQQTSKSASSESSTQNAESINKSEINSELDALLDQLLFANVSTVGPEISKIISKEKNLKNILAIFLEKAISDVKFFVPIKKLFLFLYKPNNFKATKLQFADVIGSKFMELLKNRSDSVMKNNIVDFTLSLSDLLKDSFLYRLWVEILYFVKLDYPFAIQMLIKMMHGNVELCFATTARKQHVNDFLNILNQKMPQDEYKEKALSIIAKLTELNNDQSNLSKINQNVLNAERQDENVSKANSRIANFFDNVRKIDRSNENAENVQKMAENVQKAAENRQQIAIGQKMPENRQQASNDQKTAGKQQQQASTSQNAAKNQQQASNAAKNQQQASNAANHAQTHQHQKHIENLKDVQDKLLKTLTSKQSKPSIVNNRTRNAPANPNNKGKGSTDHSDKSILDDSAKKIEKIDVSKLSVEVDSNKIDASKLNAEVDFRMILENLILKSEMLMGENPFALAECVAIALSQISSLNVNDKDFKEFSKICFEIYNLNPKMQKNLLKFLKAMKLIDEIDNPLVRINRFSKIVGKIIKSHQESSPNLNLSSFFEKLLDAIETLLIGSALNQTVCNLVCDLYLSNISMSKFVIEFIQKHIKDVNFIAQILFNVGALLEIHETENVDEIYTKLANVDLLTVRDNQWANVQNYSPVFLQFHENPVKFFGFVESLWKNFMEMPNKVSMFADVIEELWENLDENFDFLVCEFMEQRKNFFEKVPAENFSETVENKLKGSILLICELNEIGIIDFNKFNSWLEPAIFHKLSYTGRQEINGAILKKQFVPKI